MNKEHPKRLAIIGLPGSGKSTFASKLGMAREFFTKGIKIWM